MSVEPKHDREIVLDINWDDIRLLSLRPGGFREERACIWAKMLTLNTKENGNEELGNTFSHPDERQIKLDTDRSFVLYPVDDTDPSLKDRENLQEELNKLIVNIFHRRPKLGYFQGYHDIVTVLFLTLPVDLRLICVESMSLQRLRDSMGAGLEPIVGLLHILKNLFELVDPAFAAVLEEASPLPYFALSNLLTLFSHDMPTLPLIQHVFDYILCRPPIIIVYLAATIALSRKAEVERLQQEGEEGMVHSVLSGLPDITDELADTNTADVPEPLPLSPHKNNFEIEQDPNPNTIIPSPSPMLEKADDLKNSYPNTPVVDFKSIGEGDEKATSWLSRPSTPLPRKPTVTLSDLLIRSDELFTLYPPSHPSLQLSSIMGPQSVVYTWSENPEQLPDPDEAEAMVDHPELVIKPLPEPHEDSDNEKSRPRTRNRKAVPHGANIMFAGTVLVLGLSIAIALYRQRDGGKDFTKASKWAGRAFLAMGGRWVAAFNGP